MRLNVRERLEKQNQDFFSVTGSPIGHFFCPYLHVDEPAELCKAHTVNSAFGGCDRSWSVQRADLDNFYGAMFESEFVLLKENGLHDAFDVLLDRTLNKKLRPQITVNGSTVEYYYRQGPTPPNHTIVQLQRDGNPPSDLVLKMPPDQVAEKARETWNTQLQVDLRTAALVSLLKCAHLTLFIRLGYTYALSAPGRFLGRDVLGAFFSRSVGRPNAQVRQDAEEFFRPLQRMVRPVNELPTGFRSTAKDGRMFLCFEGSALWAFVVVIATGAQKHVVMVPTLDSPAAVERLLTFLRDSSPNVNATACTHHPHKWELGRTHRIAWPV